MERVHLRPRQTKSCSCSYSVANRSVCSDFASSASGCHTKRRNLWSVRQALCKPATRWVLSYSIMCCKERFMKFQTSFGYRSVDLTLHVTSPEVYILLPHRGYENIIKGSLVCKTSVLRTFHSCSKTTHHTPLIIHHSSNHHSSYTTHHTPLIIHHSSYTTHHTPLIKPPLIIHHSSYTTHHTPLIIHHSSYTTHHTPLIMHHSSCTTHQLQLALVSIALAPVSSGFNSASSRQLCEPPCADFVAGTTLSWHSSYTTHHTPLIIHHSSCTTHHAPLISSSWR